MQDQEQLEEEFARRKLVEAVENQIADGHPREAGLVLMALLSKGLERDDVLWAMAQVLAEHISQAMASDQPFDLNGYARDLLALTTEDDG